MRIALEIGFSFKWQLDEDDRSIEIPPKATVHDALEAIAVRHPQISARLFDENGKIKRNINALINGGNVQWRRGFDTELKDGDRLTILPPMGGG